MGTILTAANQGATLMDGDFPAATWVRAAVNYAVPFLVSSIGYLAPLRTVPTDRGEAPSDRPGAAAGG